MDARRKHGRLSLRIEERLLKNVQRYAQDRGVSITFLVEKHFEKLLDEEKERTVEAEQV